MKLKIGFPGRLLPLWKQNISSFLLRIIKPFTPFKINPFVIGLLLLWFIVFLLGVCKCKAQQLTPVQVGDQVPDVAINVLLNYPTEHAQVSDFKGKLLIIDFWENWCHACIASTPKLVELQKAFGSRLQIIAVSSQNAQAIEKVFSKNEYLKGLKVTFATEDKVLANLFPHKTIPHIAWISPDGKYLGSTSQNDLNETNINSILSTGVVHFSEYKNDNLSFDPGKPMFSDSTAFGLSYLFKSGFSAYQPGVPTQSGLDHTGDRLRMYGINVDLFDLTCLSLSVLSQTFTPNRIVYADTSLRRRFKYDKLLHNRESIYCYEIVVPVQQKPSLYRIMRDEVSNATQIVVDIRRIPVQCYVIKTDSGIASLSEGFLTNPTSMTKANADAVSFKWMINLVTYLNKLPGMVPVIDESGNNERTEIELEPGKPDFDSLSKALHQKGLVLSKEERMLEMMYVSAKVYDPIFTSE